jgi:hypothetical protein
VDFVKMDDSSLGNVYHQDEIEMVREALDEAVNESGRPMVLSLSPGPPPFGWRDHVRQYSDMWRITADFWDNWPQLFGHFQQFEVWNPYRSEGHWPDGDLLPVGRIDYRSQNPGPERMTNLTHDEQVTLMSLWSIARSPLMIGGNLPANDQFTLDLLTNDEVLAVNQNSSNNAPIYPYNGSSAAWKADAPFGKYVALFSFVGGPVSVDLASLGFSPQDRVRVRDLWSHTEVAVTQGSFSDGIAAHGAGLYLIRPYLEGDYNGNGVVDAADYTVWRNTLGSQVAPYTGADFNGDGFVRSNDYFGWSSNYGEIFSAAAAVPEPSCFLLALSALVLFGRRRPSRRDA